MIFFVRVPRLFFFLDYIAYSKLPADILVEIVKGLNRGCIQAGCSLIGGETAQMPGMYNKGEYDLAGFCVGVVERDRIIDGSGIEADDILIGISSNGIHSNGFSLVRKVFSKKELRRYAPELLKPTRIYVKPVLSLLDYNSSAIKGVAHITGGAFYDKISRILPNNLNARINKGSWQVPDIFKLIQNKGKINDQHMHHTFNMGIGMVLIVKPEFEQRIKQLLSKFHLHSYTIGLITKGKKEVEIV